MKPLIHFKILSYLPGHFRIWPWASQQLFLHVCHQQWSIISQKSGILVLHSLCSIKFVLMCPGGTQCCTVRKDTTAGHYHTKKIIYKPIFLINNEMNILTAIVTHCIVRTGNGISCSLYSWVGVTDHFTTQQFSNYWHGKGTFYLWLAFWEYTYIFCSSLTHCYVIRNLKQNAVYDTRYAVTRQHSGKVTWHIDFCDKCFRELKHKCESKLKRS